MIIVNLIEEILQLVRILLKQQETVLMLETKAEKMQQTELTKKLKGIIN
jgi:hypothetical protein